MKFGRKKKGQDSAEETTESVASAENRESAESATGDGEAIVNASADANGNAPGPVEPGSGDIAVPKSAAASSVSVTTAEQEKRAQGIGVQGNALRSALILGVVLVVLTAASTLAYLFLLREPGQQQAILAEVARGHAEEKARSVQSAVSELRERIASAAASPVAIEAIARADTAAVKTAEEALKFFFPLAKTVRLLPLDDMGTAYLDGGEELRNHIEVDLVRRAINDADAKPEAYQIDGEWLLSFAEVATHPSLDDRSAVLMVTLPQEQLQAWLATAGELPGQYGLQQRIRSGGGVLDIDILSVGSSGSGDDGIEIAPVIGTDWKVVFRPGTELQQSVTRTVRGDIDLLGILAVIALLAVLLTGMRSKSAVDRDTRAILDGADQRKHLDVQVPQLAPVGRELRKLSLRGPRSNAPSATRSPGGGTASINALTAIEGPAEQKLPAHIFRAYDIRGVADTELNDEIAFRIARAIGTLAAEAEEKTIILGHDGRNSSERLRAVVEKGLLESGRDVVNIGLVPTPLLYYATQKLEAQSGVMITGSHNPAEFNGMKIVLKREPVAEGTLGKLLDLAQSGAFTTGSGKVAQPEDVLTEYLDEVVGDIAMAVPLKIVVDASNGTAGKVAPALLEELGCEVVQLNCEVDGNFPGHGPDTSNEDNLKQLVSRVVSEKADFGVMYDGDGDRLAVVTPRGDILRTDRLMMLFARDVVARNPGADVVYDVKCSRILGQMITSLGGRPVLWKTGHALMKQKMAETGALLGGEFSGHVFFGERWYGFDDGMYATSRLAEILSSHEGDLDELLGDLPTSVSTPEMLVKVEESEKFELMARFVAEAKFESGKRNELDGLRMDFEDGWGLLRASNTSAALTARFEANDEMGLQRIMASFRQQLQSVSPDLEIPF